MLFYILCVGCSGTVCRGIVKRFGKKLEVVNVQA